MDRSRTGTPSWPVFNRIPVTNATAPSPPRIRGPRQSGGRNPRPGAFPPIQNGTAETVPMPRRDFLDFAELSNPIAVGWKTRGDFFKPLKDFWPAGVEQKWVASLRRNPFSSRKGAIWRGSSERGKRGARGPRKIFRPGSTRPKPIISSVPGNKTLRVATIRAGSRPIAVSGDGRFSRRGPSESVSNGHRGRLYVFTLLRFYHCKRRNSALNPGPTAIIKP